MRDLVETRLFLQHPKRSLPSGHTHVDMHVHTRYSDGLSTVQKIAQKAQAQGIGVAITDHNEIRGALEMENENVFSIPGIEIGGKEGMHILLYFQTAKDLHAYYRKHVEPYKLSNNFYVLSAPTLQLVKAAQDYPCVICAAHPFGAGATGAGQPIHDTNVSQAVFDELDAIELFNAGCLRAHNIKALRFAELTPFALTGGSDAHTLREVGRAVTSVEGAQTPEAFLQGIIDNKSFVTGREDPVVYKPYTKIGTIHNFSKAPVHYGRFVAGLVKRRIRQRKEEKKTG